MTSVAASGVADSAMPMLARAFPASTTGTVIDVVPSSAAASWPARLEVFTWLSSLTGGLRMKTAARTVSAPAPMSNALDLFERTPKPFVVRVAVSLQRAVVHGIRRGRQRVLGDLCMEHAFEREWVIEAWRGNTVGQLH